MLKAASGWIFRLATKLAALTAAHGPGVYPILFAMIFVETGVVVLPFLPGVIARARQRLGKTKAVL